MRLTVGQILFVLSLCCICIEGLLSSKDSLRQEEGRVPTKKEASGREASDSGRVAIEATEESREEEEVEVSLFEEELAQEEQGTILGEELLQEEEGRVLDTFGGAGDSDLEDDDDVFWSEPVTAFEKEMKEDKYFGREDLEDGELNSNLSDEDFELFKKDSEEHDTNSDMLQDGENLLEGGAEGSKDRATGIEDLDADAQAETLGDVGRVEREAVVGGRRARDGEWMRVAEWVHYPALPHQ